MFSNTFRFPNFIKGCWGKRIENPNKVLYGWKYVYFEGVW